MNRSHSQLEVKLWGDYACFTRPEMKVERVTYPVMTPSAARGALEAIFWKPQVVWSVEEIHVLRPIKYASILRNEINDRQSWAKGSGGYDAAASRAQRHTLALRDVAYVVRAKLTLQEGVGDNIAKYSDQFRRRVATGRCFATPYLGCREFSASFGEPDPDTRPISHSEDLGLMLLDIDYEHDGSGRGMPHFFHATLNRGVLHVPDRFVGIA